MYISHQAVGFFILFLLFWAFAYAFNHWFKSRINSRGRSGSLFSRPRSKPVPRRPVDADPYSKLVGICFGDKSKADRLIAFEQSRRPGLSRLSAIQSAIDSIARDRHRY